MKLSFVSILIFSSVVFSNASAQTAILVPPTPIPPGSIPSAIAAAKTVFISNETYVIENINNPSENGGPTLAYDQFFAALKATGRLQIVDDPAKADIVLVLQILPADRIPLEIEGARVLVYDGKTHFVLWTLVRRLDTCATISGCVKSLDRAVQGLANDLATLCGKSPSAK